MAKTKVVFRRWRSAPQRGEVIALFPEVPGGSHLRPSDCLSYMHVGQHGAADPDFVVSESLPAASADSEVRALADELHNAGYDLKVVMRCRWTHYATRRTLCAQLAREDHTHERTF